ncbi:NUDIX hydrolase [Lactiplantibacillus herbarum]|uniref:NUDIX hydrolase n=1 Tax=Lactiplantibacillus herbarum TaxID=1670446 RepID=UPI00064E4C51|nr:NUDIX domain-containing protein [Lactiplantibacillus herbarum]
MVSEVINRPLISITNVIWSFDTVTKQLLVLMIQRDNAPFEGTWGLPTTYLRADESADAAALRLVREKMGVTVAGIQAEQLGTFTAVNRVPDERSLALTYMVYLPVKPELVPGYGAQAAEWFAVTPAGERDDFVANDLVFRGLADEVTATQFYASNAQELTADHALILRTALQRVRNRLDYEPTILRVFGDQFTLKQARELYAILRRQSVSQIDNSNFRKTHVHLFEELGTVRLPTMGRPAKVYRLKGHN